MFTDKQGGEMKTAFTPNTPAILIERDTTQPKHTARYWIREEGQQHPYAYVKRCPGGWWLGGLQNLAGYYPTRKAAIAAAV